MNIKLTHLDIIHLYGNSFAGLSVNESGIWAYPLEKHEIDGLTSNELLSITPLHGFEEPLLTFPCTPTEFKTILKQLGYIPFTPAPVRIGSGSFWRLSGIQKLESMRRLCVFALLDDWVSKRASRIEELEALTREDPPETKPKASFIRKIKPGPGRKSAEITRVIDSLFSQLKNEGKIEFLRPERVVEFIKLLKERAEYQKDDVSKEFKLKDSLQTYSELIEKVMPNSLDSAVFMRNPRQVRGEGLKKQPYTRRDVRRRLYELNKIDSEIFKPSNKIPFP